MVDLGNESMKTNDSWGNPAVPSATHLLRSRRHLVTGANGFVGSNLCRRLAWAGADVVALSRAGRTRTREAILGAACAYRWPLPESAALQFQDCRLDVHGLALPADALKDLFAEPVDFWHVAASVSFSSTRRSEVIESNREGTRRALDLFATHAPRGSRFLLVSTAYVQGREQGCLQERFLEPASENAFHNAYEYSKREAEILFEQYRERGLVDGAILRLGQIVGDSETGAITAPYGVYGFVDLIKGLSRHAAGSSARLPSHIDSGLHLLPVDWCIDGMLRAVERLALWPGEPVFHVVPARPLSVPAFIDVLNAHTSLKVNPVRPEDFNETPANEVERVVCRGSRSILPYILRRYEFACENMVLLSEQPWIDVVSPELTDRLLRSYLRVGEEAA